MKIPFKQVVDLRLNGFSLTMIAAKVGVSKSSVANYLNLVERSFPTLEEASKLPAEELDKLFVRKKAEQVNCFLPDFELVFEANQRKGRHHKDLKQLYAEYVADAPSGMKILSYQSFCRRFRTWRADLPARYRELQMTCLWEPGDVVQIDYSGDGLCYQDPATGRSVKVQIFVGVLAFSGKTFCIATPGQTRDDWLDAQVAMFEYFGGVTQNILLDNSTSLVSKADIHAPVVSKPYLDFCGYYQTVPVPVRPAHPRDKGLVENAVGLIQRRILDPLMQEQFLSIADINERLNQELEAFNNAPLSGRTNTTRESLFQEEKPLLRPLPPVPFDPSRIVKNVRVGKNYQIRWNNKRYSVPYAYAGCTVKVTEFPRAGNKLVISDLRTGEVIAEYVPDEKVARVIRYEHMPEQHRAMMLTAQQLKSLISLIGPNSKGLSDAVWAHCQGMYRTKVLRHLNSLKNSLGSDLFEECAAQTLKSSNPSYRTFEDIVNKIACPKRETIRRTPCRPAMPIPANAPAAANVRGSDYYREQIEEMDSPDPEEQAALEEIGVM